MKKENIVFEYWAAKLGFGKSGMKLPRGLFFSKTKAPIIFMGTTRKGKSILDKIYMMNFSDLTEDELKKMNDSLKANCALKINFKNKAPILGGNSNVGITK